jgi:hypothetical protein
MCEMHDLGYLECLLLDDPQDQHFGFVAVPIGLRIASHLRVLVCQAVRSEEVLEVSLEAHNDASWSQTAPMVSSWQC